MGYYASASGSANLKKEVTVEQVDAAIEKFYKENPKFSPLGYDFDEKDGYIDIYDDEKWHEEDTEKFLEVIAPFITSGTLDYSGEDDCFWRFVFDAETGKWKEENGRIDFNFESYSDKEMIAEMEKRGYTCTKKEEGETA